MELLICPLLQRRNQSSTCASTQLRCGGRSETSGTSQSKANGAKWDSNLQPFSYQPSSTVSQVIAAEGEKAACEALKVSVESLSGSPLVVHLRLLQLLHNLRSEQPAVVLNIPPDVLTQSIDLASLTRPANQSLTAADGPEDATKDSPMM